MRNSIRGKTYTLCDDGGGSDGVCARLSAVADDVLDHGACVDVLAQVVAMSRQKRLLKRIAGAPVVGIPLDANRCARWWGQFHPNTVNLRRLEDLLGNDTLLSFHSPA